MKNNISKKFEFARNKSQKISVKYVKKQLSFKYIKYICVVKKENFDTIQIIRC